MKLSIVATLYKSSVYISEFHQRVSAAARQLVGDDYEIVFVNDGSPDNSLDVAVGISDYDSHVVVVDLSRNFGHHKAMMTGLANTNGQHIFLIDCDLEEEPEWLLSFAEQMSLEKCDVVYGVQDRRKGGLFEKLSGQCFYYALTKITGLSIPANMVTARLMTRRYVSSLLLHDEREVFLAGLFYITGFEQSPCMVRKHNTSETTYTIGRKIALFVNSITAFSTSPLIAIFYFGLIVSFVAGSYSAFLVINWMFFAKPVSGWTSVMVSLWLLGGLIACFIGVVGIYLSKIFSESKRRPYTITRKVYSQNVIFDDELKSQQLHKGSQL